MRHEDSPCGTVLKKAANALNRLARSSRRLTMPSSLPPSSEQRSRSSLPSTDAVSYLFSTIHRLFRVTLGPTTPRVARLVRSSTTARMTFETGDQRSNRIMPQLRRLPLQKRSNQLSTLRRMMAQRRPRLERRFWGRLNNLYNF